MTEPSIDTSSRSQTTERGLSLARRHGWSVVQLLAFAVAAYCSVQGARVLNEAPHAVFDSFDEGAAWLGAALLATVVFAWTPGRPHTDVREWPGELRQWLRSHWVEVALLAAILAFGLFMRFFRYQDTISPADSLCCEEHINGGIAYRTLEGERPLLFPTERWASAIGFLIFGENTLGLRFFYTAAGAAELVVFFLLLRQLVSAPVALFTLALYSAAWWPSLANRHVFQTTLFFSLLFALLLVKGVKSRNAVTFVGLGALAGLISYEYEAFKPVPMVGVAFLAAAAVAVIVLPLTSSLHAVGERLLGLGKTWWRPALAFIMACGIVLTPMVIGTRNGFDLYLTSVHRNEADRGGSRLAENWEEQLKWATQLVLPFGPREYRADPPLDVAGEQLLDPIAATLAVAGLVAGIVFFFRGYRLLFVMWTLAVLGGGSLFLQNWLSWKFFSVVPVLLVLAAFLIDDLRAWIMRLFGQRGAAAVAAVLVVAAAFSFWWNADKLFNDAPPKIVASGVYEGDHDQYYGYCHYLQGRGGANFAISSNHALTNLGFQNKRETWEDQLKAWGDLIWVCHDLQGEALAAADEGWPLRDLPEGRTTLVLAHRESLESSIEALTRAYPRLGTPDHFFESPNGTYTIVAWEFESGDELARSGLRGEYTAAGSDGPALTRDDPAHDISWEELGLPLDPPFDVRWRGVVYVEQEGNLRLEAETDDPVRVLIDGDVVHSTVAGGVERNAPLLRAGWHAVEITVAKESVGGGMRLVWVDQEGLRVPVVDEDLFPLNEWTGWLHERTLVVPDTGQRLVSQRFDFQPHRALTSVLGTNAPVDQFALTVQDRWSAVWQPAAGRYVVSVRLLGGSVQLLIDGESVGLSAVSDGTVETELVMDGEQHRIEFVQNIPPDPNQVPQWAGFDVSLLRQVPRPDEAEPLRVPVPLETEPY